MLRKTFSCSVRRCSLETLEARLCMAADDFAELNATQWGTFASDAAAASIVDDRSRKFSGEASLLFRTDSGFDTGVRYPNAGNANWDLSGKDYLSFLQFPVNNTPFGFQGNQPVVVLQGDGGAFRFTPTKQLTFNNSWQKMVVDLDGNGTWRRETVGSPSFSNIDQLEIHYDTWDSGFSIGIDAVNFGSFTTLTSGPSPVGVVPEVVRSKALVYIFDPIMENLGGKRMHEAFGWEDPQLLTQRVSADLQASSHNRVQYSVAETQIVDLHPVYKDGFQHTDESFTAAWDRREFPQAGFDYERFLLQNGIAARIDSGEIDEVWLWAGPMGGFWESAMAGEGAYWINGPVQSGGGKRAFPIMGWNFERGVAEAIHSFGHRAENSVFHAYRDWQGSGSSTWTQFGAIDKDSSGNGGVGNVHFPVNGLSDYDYDNPTTVQSAALDWKNYPNLTGAKTAVNNRTWSPDGADPQRQYLNWWYSLMPAASGLGNDGYLANWWRYIADVDSYKQRDGRLADASGLIDVRVVGPTAGATLPATTHTFTAEALADGAIGRVDFYVDGVFAYSDSLGPYVFQWNAANQFGNHTIVAKAYEVANNWEFASTPLAVTVVGSAWTNWLRKGDVNADGLVSAIDALHIINELNATGARKLPTERPATFEYFDTSGDGLLSALDALTVINLLIKAARVEGEQLSPFVETGNDASSHATASTDPAIVALAVEWNDDTGTDVLSLNRRRVRVR